MGKKAITVSTATRPAINDQNTEESFRVLEGRLQQLENLVSPGEQQSSEYDDAFIRGQIRELRRELEEHNHRKQQVSAGDSYASDFKATYSGSGSNIAISTGYYLFPERTEVVGGDVTISSSNGTHFIYLLLTQNSGTWTASFVEALDGYPYAQVDRIPYIIAQVDVVGGAIDEDTLIQHQFGEVKNAAGCREVRYRADFAVLQTATPLRVDVRVGAIIAGTTFLPILSTAEVIPSGTDTYYVYCQLYDNIGAEAEILVASAYPESTTTHEKFVLAEVDVANSIITDVRQVQQGSFSSSRIWD